MTRPILKRNNWFDGQNVTEDDLDTEQTAWHDSLANNTDFLAGSGVEQEFSVQRVLFDTNDVPASIQSLIDTESFDGEAIFPTDAFGNTVFLQPSDFSQGNQLDVEITGSSLDGAPIAKVYIFGAIFGDVFTQEVLTFTENDSQITRNYFTKIIAIMTQDFLGNQNTLIDGVKSRDNGGRLRVLEALPMRVARDTIMAEQALEPNQDYVNFKPATLFKTLDILLDEIAASDNRNKDDLNINVTSTDIRKLLPNEVGVIIGEKFQATTDNIQKITILLSVEKRLLVPPGEEFDWTGDLVIGIRPLQTAATCPTDIIPGTPIEFDPELSPIAEVSFNKDELADLGIVLDDTAQEVDFIFTQSLLANPNIEPSIIPDAFYVVTIRRTGNVSVGTIILEVAANTDADPDDIDNMRMTIFSQNSWTDIPESDLWFKIHTDALRIVDGTAFDAGVQITSPKVKQNVITGLEEPFIQGRLSLIDVSQNADNFIIVQQANNFTDPKPQPATGNLVFTRIEDVPNVSVVSESSLTTLLDAGNKTIVLGSAVDTNPVGNPTITDFTEFPGLQDPDKFTIIAPDSDILISNLVGSILIPNTADPNIKFRIIKQETFTDAYGDVNNDGIIDNSDVVRAQLLGNVVSGDGYSKDLETGAMPSADQRNGVVSGNVTMEEIIRADVNNDGLISTLDATLIQQNIALGTAFTAGSTFTRVVLTVENVLNPLTTSPDIVASISEFNDVPFTALEFRIEFVPLWDKSNIDISDLRRFVPKTFTDIESSDITGTIKNGGENTSFVPGDLLLAGEILNINNTPHPLDFEVNTVVIDLPEGSTQGEVDVFNEFIKNEMKFSDGTLVPLSALANNQVKVSASIQSFVKDIDGYDFESVDGYAAIDETIAVLYTPTSGLLRIRADNIRNISTRLELRTKIILTVYLKKAGFLNTEQTVTGTDLTGLLIPL